MFPREVSLALCGFLPGSPCCPDDGEFHRVELPEGQKRLESLQLAGGGFGWALAIGAGADAAKRTTLHWGRPPFPSSPSSSGIDGVLLAAAGYDHAVVSKKPELHDDGSLWFCGWAAGALGARRRRKKEEEDARGSSLYVAAWTRLPLPPSSDPVVSALACGFDRTLALTSSSSSAEEGGGGQLWEWGVGEAENEQEEAGSGDAPSEGEAGGRDSRPLPLPRLVPFPRGTRIASVSAGAHHCAALDSQGALWTWGGNLRGQCGVVVGGASSPSSSSSPIERENLSVRVPAPTRNATLGGVRLRAVAAGGSHTLVLCESGSLFGFGSNGSGQLGFLTEEEGGGKAEEKEHEPSLSSTRLPMPVAVERGGARSLSCCSPSFASISAGATHSLALAEGGREVFVLGRVSPSSSASSPPSSSSPPRPSGGGGGGGAFGGSAALSPPFCPPRRATLPAGARAAAVASGWWHAMISLLVEGEGEEGGGEAEEAEEEAGAAPEEEREASSDRRAAKRTKEN